MKLILKRHQEPLLNTVLMWLWITSVITSALLKNEQSYEVNIDLEVNLETLKYMESAYPGHTYDYVSKIRVFQLIHFTLYLQC